MTAPKSRLLDRIKAVTGTSEYKQTLESMRNATASTAKWLAMPPWDLPLGIDEMVFPPEDEALILGLEVHTDRWRLDIASLEANDLLVDVSKSFVVLRDLEHAKTHRQLIELLESPLWDGMLRTWACQHCERVLRRS